MNYTITNQASQQKIPGGYAGLEKQLKSKTLFQFVSKAEIQIAISFQNIQKIIQTRLKVRGINNV